ncbi:AEC family transporter [Microbacterium sp. SORGH_AS_0862]|uniref:AEC family transporter n=1 Tax=Microbacterium sp. SORGH_AS_0862 TaxID=3041789 RepID=UPI00279115CD|nr:AEC family transporter [Microbacterium sp. SORGH_AS_0862]MDQ1206936.1 malonate transporter [Microbacterium sp. SORGH_AS_0862]
MLETLTGFAVVGTAIIVGYIIGRVDLLGPHARHVLSRLTFYVLSPFLLFTVLSQADITTLFSALLPVSTAAAAMIIGLQWLLSRFIWRRSVADATISSLSAGQVNSNNIGIPLSLYLLGSAAYPAPVILMQLLLLTPIALAILDAATTGTRSFWRVLGRTARNPIVIGSALGTLVSISGVSLPTIVLEPALLIANACVPVLLISYGISLHGQRVLADAGRRGEVLIASVLKLFAMPAAAWALATLFGLSAHEVLVVTVLAALPTAQNVFNYAQRYAVGESVARDTIFLTTLGSVPVLLGIVLLL